MADPELYAAVVDGSSLPGQPAVPDSTVGTAVATVPGSGSILDLLHEVNDDGRVNYVFWRQLEIINPPLSRPEDTVVAVMTDDYTILHDDEFVRLGYQTSADKTFTLPDVDGTDVAIGWYIWVDNQSEHDLTVDPHGSDTIDGETDLEVATNQSVLLQVESTTAWTVLGYGDLIPDDTMFEQIDLGFTTLRGWATYTFEGVEDNQAVTRQTFDEMIMLRGRQHVGSEIVNPTRETSWKDEGFVKSPSLKVDVLRGEELIFDQPGVWVSRAMQKVAMSYGGSSGCSMVCDPRFCAAIRNARSQDGAKGIGFPELNLNQVVEQVHGFGIAKGDLLAIVGMFSPATASVVWKQRPSRMHDQMGEQLLEWKGTFCISSRSTLAVRSPLAFVRLIAD